MKASHSWLLLCVVAVLASCGGNGGSDGAGTNIVVSDLSFPLWEAKKTSVIYGRQTEMAVSGTCSGRMLSATQPAVSATFEGIVGYSGLIQDSIFFDNCVPSVISSSETDYYDNNYVELGFVSADGQYGIFQSPPVYPDLIKVGDRGTIGTVLVYTDSSKSVSYGLSVISYIVEPDTATTAIIDFVSLTQYANGSPNATMHNRYRIYPSGEMVYLSSEIQSSTVNLIMKAAPDIVAPGIFATQPDYGPIASSLPTIAATLNEGIDPLTVSSNSLTLISDVGGAISGTTRLVGRKLIFEPTVPLPYSGIYTVTAHAGIKDLTGNLMAANSSWTFEVDQTSPVVISTMPANQAVNVPILTSVTANFSEYIDSASITSLDFKLMDGVNQVAGALGGNGAYATFTPSSPLSPNTTYTAVITTGVKDLVGNPMSTQYSWTFTTFDVQYRDPVAAWVGAQGEAAVIGDVNNDGKNDALMTSRDSLNPSLAYGLHVALQGTAGLSAALTYTTHSSLNCLGSSISIGDVNHDGRNDVVIGNSGCGIEVFLQNSAGGLDPGVVYPSSDGVKLRIADLNNDGRLDVVGVGIGTGTASVWLQNTGGTLNAPVIYNIIHTGGEDLEVGDVNNDGLQDIVISSTSQQLAVLTQATSGIFNLPIYYNVGNYQPVGVAVGDINGDLLSDVVVTLNGGTVSQLGVFYQNSAGTMDAVVALATDNLATSVETADVNVDGRKDVIVHHYAFGRLGVYLQSANGSLQSEQLYSAPYGRSNPQCMSIGDINSDGKPDAVFSGFELIYHY